MPIPGLAWLFVEVETDEGITGLGECTDYAVNGHLVRGLEAIKPLVIGSDPKNIEEIWQRIFHVNSDLNGRGYSSPLISAIDIALWDIFGKASNLPIYKLLGGRRDKIKSYASTVMYETIDEYMNVIDQKQKEGFSAVKFHTWCIPNKDIELAKEARKNFPKISFMLDVENNYDFESSLKVAKELDSGIWVVKAQIHAGGRGKAGGV